MSSRGAPSICRNVFSRQLGYSINKSMIAEKGVRTLQTLRMLPFMQTNAFFRMYSSDLDKYKIVEVHKNKKNNDSINNLSNKLTVCLVGRTNVGKSALFNRLSQSRDAIVCKEMNTTRDRREGEGRISGLEFHLIDTGGVWMQPKEGSIESAINFQTSQALLESNIILFLLDIREGVTPQDKDIARWLRSSMKHNNFKVQVVLNKCEGNYIVNSSNFEYILKDVYSLGFGAPIGISAEHGEGMLDIFDILSQETKLINNETDKSLEEVLKQAEKEINMNPVDDEVSLSSNDIYTQQGYKSIDILTRKPCLDDEELSLCIIGRPNSGKSTLLNKLIGKERFITGELPGLTRDSVIEHIQYKGRNIKLVDTAGIQKNAYHGEKTANSLSIWNTYKSISLSNVVCLLLDGEKQLTREELTFANKAIDEGKALFVCLNKADLFSDPSAVKKALIQYIYKFLPQIGRSPTLLLSGLTGVGIDSFFDVSIDQFMKWRTRISTGILNRWLRDAVQRQTPPRDNGREVKLKYITQIKTRPPTFVVFSNRNSVSDTYIRYLETGLRQEFGYNGIPIRIYIRASEPRE
ncbi:hypothetical protein WA158_005182 [Blastocystis sp. Blastoise]